MRCSSLGKREIKSGTKERKTNERRKVRNLLFSWAKHALSFTYQHVSYNYNTHTHTHTYIYIYIYIYMCIIHCKGGLSTCQSHGCTYSPRSIFLTMAAVWRPSVNKICKAISSTLYWLTSSIPIRTPFDSKLSPTVGHRTRHRPRTASPAPLILRNCHVNH